MFETDFEEKSSPTKILPEKSVLGLETYLKMQATLGDQVQFRVLYALKRIDNAEPDDLADLLDMDADTVESSLDELVNVGLAERRMQRTPEMDESEVRIYYRASSLGEGLLEEGIEHLLHMEWESLERYS